MTSSSQVVTRDLPPLSLRAAFLPTSINVEKRTIDLVFSTGAPVLRGYFERYYETLSLDPSHVRMERMNSGAPLLDTHDSYELRGVIGVVEAGTAKVNGKQGTCTVRFAKAEDDPEADAIFRKVRDGIIQNVSVGYAVRVYEKTEDVENKIPTYRAIDWEPYEVSLVPMGADPGAGVRSSEPHQTAPCQFITRQETAPMKPEIPNTEAAPAGTEQRTAAATTETPAAGVTEARAQATEAEKQRQQTIRTVVRKAGLAETVADDMVARNLTVDAARAEVLDALTARTDENRTSTVIAAVPGGDATDKMIRGMSNWLIRKAGLAPTIVRAEQLAGNERFKDSDVDPGEYRGMTLLELGKECLARAGQNVRGLDKSTLADRIMKFRGVYGGQGTSDFQVALENVLNKTLLGQYRITPDTWSRFCNRGSVTDFRSSNRYRRGSLGRLATLNEHGEFQNVALSDAEKQTIAAATVGNIIALSRQVLINDDMGFLNSTTTMLGRAAKLSPEIDVYALLLGTGDGNGPVMSDGIKLFHATHKNVGTAAALSVAALDGDRVLMGKQTDKDGNDFLDIRPAILLVPIGLGGDARVINDAQYDPDTANKLQRPNKVRGMVRDIIDTPRLTDATRRYLFADPADVPTIEVAFLEGQSEPVLETQAGWRVDGMEWKVRYDYGVAAIDFRGAVVNAGA
jgi:phage head maturation protease